MSKSDTEMAEEPVCADESVTHTEDNTTLLHNTNTAWNRQINRSHYKSRGDLHTLFCHRYAIYSQDKINKELQFTTP